MCTNEKACALLQLGYQDYIAARYLINNGLILQGVTLASTAVEKYIKVIITAKGKNIKVHLDRIDLLKKKLSECYVDFTDQFDERFLDILAKAYRVRYYDDLNATVTIGFFVNQFLCELDYVIHFFETVLYPNIEDEAGNQILTHYKHDAKLQTTYLVENNYLFMGITKKEFMEKPGYCFCIYINPFSFTGDILTRSKEISNTYDGRITLIKIEFARN